MVPSGSTTSSPLRSGTTHRQNFGMRILHPFPPSYRWSEHGVDAEGNVIADNDGRWHLHVEYEDGASVCVVVRAGVQENLTSNRVLAPIPGTDDFELVGHLVGGQD